MGRKVDLLILLNKRINMMRKLQYHVEVTNLQNNEVEGLIDFLEDVLTEDLLEIILMDLKEAKRIEDWSIRKLKELGKRLHIKYWSSLSKDELICQIRAREAEVMLYYPNFVYREELQDAPPGKDPLATTKRRRLRKYQKRDQAIRDKISRDSEHGSSYGRV